MPAQSACCRISCSLECTSSFSVKSVLDHSLCIHTAIDTIQKVPPLLSIHTLNYRRFSLITSDLTLYVFYSVQPPCARSVFIPYTLIVHLYSLLVVTSSIIHPACPHFCKIFRFDQSHISSLTPAVCLTSFFLPINPGHSAHASYTLYVRNISLRHIFLLSKPKLILTPKHFFFLASKVFRPSTTLIIFKQRTLLQMHKQRP